MRAREGLTRKQLGLARAKEDGPENEEKQRGAETKVLEVCMSNRIRGELCSKNFGIVVERFKESLRVFLHRETFVRAAYSRLFIPQRCLFVSRKLEELLASSSVKMNLR